MGGRIKGLKKNIQNSILYKVILKMYINNKIRRYTSCNDPIRLDLGCGSSKKDGFIGIDLSSNADLRWDLTLGLPFDDDTISIIRSDHFFEHLEQKELIALLMECRRVLVPEGILNFSVPHLDPYIEAYLTKNYDFLQEKITDIPDGDELLYSTCFDLILWLLYRNGEHKSMFDKESIIAKVKLAGFRIITTREYDPEKDVNSRFSSIYVMAIK